MAPAAAGPIKVAAQSGETTIGNSSVLGGNSDPIRQSLAKALGHPLPNVVYAGGENRFRPIVESFRQELAAEAGTPAGCGFVFNPFYLPPPPLAPPRPPSPAP